MKLHWQWKNDSFFMENQALLKKFCINNNKLGFIFICIVCKVCLYAVYFILTTCSFFIEMFSRRWRPKPNIVLMEHSLILSCEATPQDQCLSHHLDSIFIAKDIS